MNGSQATPRPLDRERAARNAPCQCGSGRKSKHCCANTRPPSRDSAKTSDPRAATMAPALEPVTDAGRFLEAYSTLQLALRHDANGIGPRRGPKPAVTRKTMQAVQASLDQAARHAAAGRLPEAIAALQSAVRLTPDSAVAHYRLGLTFWNASRSREAVASLRTAISLQPNFGRAHLCLGAALQDLGYTTDAIAALRTAIALRADVREAHARLGDLLRAHGDAAGAAASYRKAADDTTRGRLQLANALMAEDRYDEAEATVRRAVALDPDSSKAAWFLGNVLLYLGRFDEAVQQSDRAIALSPVAVSPYYTRALAKRFIEADRPLVAQMERVLRTTALSDVARMKLEYTLGKAYDDLSEYAQAMRHFDAANRIEKTLSVYDRAQKAAWVDTISARYTPQYFAEHAALGADDETPVLVLGMPRSGTTLVEQIVSSHPQAAGGGELDFWLQRGQTLEAPSVTAAHALADDYRALLRRIAPDAARVTDKMPHNFQMIGLIHLAFPRARIIHCRRHPVDTCLSIYFTDFMQRKDFASDRGNLVAEYRQYERLMAHWRTVLPPDRFLEVDYEALVDDQELWTRRVIDFCGLPWDAACLRPERNTRIVQTASLRQARQPVYRSSVGRWQHYEPWLGALRELLPAGTAAPTDTGQ
ncbi:MAG TPA: sulfotransferase [Acetobacteraceae bacterium]|nr:sulfotransferase [Acetobacteraceae bacterium]